MRLLSNPSWAKCDKCPLPFRKRMHLLKTCDAGLIRRRQVRGGSLPLGANLIKDKSLSNKPATVAIS